jgi:LysM domain
MHGGRVLEDEGHDEAGLIATRSPAAPTVPISSIAPVGSCPYLHLPAGGRLEADGAACLASAPAIRISVRQVELLCAGPAHVDCPRHIHGGVGERPVAPPPRRPGSNRGRLPVADAAEATGSAGTRPTAPFGARRPDHDGPPIVPGIAGVGIVGVAAVSSSALPPTAVSPSAVPSSADPSSADPPIGWRRSDPLTVPTPSIEPPIPMPTERARDVVRAAGSGSAIGLASSEPPSGRARSLFGSTEPARVAASGNTALGRARRAIGGSQAHERSVVLRPATAVASLTLVAAILIAIAFVAAHGGLTLPSPSPVSSGLGAGAVGSPGASPSPATPAASASLVVVTPGQGSPAAPASGSPAPATGPAPSPTPSGLGSKLALLTPCPGRADCYQYRIAKGDTLSSIAKFFALPVATIRKLNPQITNPSLIHVGQVITLPTPGG